MIETGVYNPSLAAGGYGMLPHHPLGGMTDPEEKSLPSLLGLMAAFYLASVPLLSYATGLGLTWVPQATGVAAGAIWLLASLITGRRLTWSWPIMLYVAWATWSSTGILVSVAPDYFLGRMKTVAKVAAVTWLMSQCVRTRADLLTALLFFSCTGLAIFLQGQEEFIRGASYTGSYQFEGKAESLFAAHTMLARVALYMFLTGLTCIIAFRRKIAKILVAALMPWPLYIIASQGSRTCMIALPLAGVCLYLFHFRRAGAGRMGKKVVLLGLGALLIGGSVFFVTKLPLFGRIHETFSSVEAIQSQSRFRYFVAGMQQVPSHPLFGLGLGGFAATGLSGAAGHGSHSDITETLTSTGVPGFLLYFSAQFVLFRFLYRLQKAALPRQHSVLVNLMMVLFCVNFFVNSIQLGIYDRVSWPLIGAMCGYLAHLKRRYLDVPAPALA